MSEPGDPATEEVASVSDDATPLVAFESCLPDAVFSQPDAEPNQFDAEPGQPDPVDGLEAVQCLRCTALLPCYARYCLHCGAAQEVPPVLEESVQAESSPVPDDAPAEVPLMDEEPPVLQAVPDDPLPAAVSTPEPTFMDLLHAEQQRVVEKLVPLESDRYWWKKYF